MRILVVEDDQLLNKTLSYNLSAVGYSVDGAMSKAVAIRFLEKQDYDLIVLDVNLPDGNGFDICREVKERRPDIAVIFLTANDMESDMLKGFELGADDYVTKPFPISVFQKKVSALLNRISVQSGGDFYDDGNLYIHFSELSACLAGQPITLTSLEYRLLKVLTRNSQTVLTRQVLLEKLWDVDENYVDEHALTTTISRIRSKIETNQHSYIKTVYGMGYVDWRSAKMISKKLSLNKVCIILATTILLLSVVMFSVLYILTKEMSVVFCSMAFCLLFLLCVTAFVILIRRKLTLFSEILCCTLDEMMNGKIDISQVAEEENLFYKINHRLVRLYEVMQESKNSVASERADLQELISDISHQVKTPISNLKMINATLLEQEVPQDKQREFLLASGTQLDKLDFLMQAMIKTSRLETGVISLEKKQQPIYDTLAMALGSIFMNAERKHIQVEVNCPETLVVSHDRKWTAEALFNILDNAVKYTPEYGSIRVCVESWEMHLKVSITDTGKGIPENQQGAIFRRFYREEDVHDIEGIGIGLYLAREIISLQNGYIQVTSQVGTGSTFSVFLPHE